jgi:hypothetical protein
MPDCDAACECGVRSMDTDVLGVPVNVLLSVSFVCVGRRLGGSGGRTEVRLRRARDLRGEVPRRSELFVESTLPWEIPWRQVMMRSLGG